MRNLFSNSIASQDAFDSINLYRKLVSLAEPIKNEYLKNVNKFHNQLTFQEINEACYYAMYSKVRPDSDIPLMPELIEKIPGLRDLNKDAYSFFLKKRNF